MGRSSIESRLLPVSEQPSSGWLGPLAWVCFVVAAATLAYFVVIDDGDTCPPGRMPWSCLSWASIDRYERQFRGDLPIGTARPRVEQYLRRENIAFSAPILTQTPSPPLLTIDKPLPGFWQPALYITIVFDA